MNRPLLSRISCLLLLVTCPLSGGAQEEDPTDRQPEVIAFGAFIPGDRLVTAGYLEKDLEPICHGTFNGHVLSLWDLATGKRLEKQVFDENLEETSVSPDGRYMASWHTEECDHFADGAIRIYSLETSEGGFGRRLGTLGGPTAHAMAVTFSPDSRRIAAAYDYPFYFEGEERPPPSYRKAVRVWDVADLSEYCWLTTEKPVYDLRFAPTNNLLAALDSSGDDPSLYLWDLERRRKLATLKMGSDNYEFGFTENGDKLVAAAVPQPVAYLVPDAATSSALEQTSIDPAAAEAAITGHGITYEQDENGTSISLVKQRREVVRLKRVPPKSGQKKNEELDVLLNSGVLAISRNGKHALVDSQILDLEEKVLRDLKLIRPKSASTWKVVPVSP